MADPVADPGALSASGEESDASDVSDASPSAADPRRVSAGAAMDQLRDTPRAEHAVCVVHGVFGAGKSHMLEAVLSFLADALGEGACLFSTHLSLDLRS